MRLVDQWRTIRRELPTDWDEARMSVTVARTSQLPRAAALLGPAGPGRAGDDLRVSVFRAGGGVGPDGFGSLLGKLDAERIRGDLALVGARERAPRAVVARHEQLAAAWKREAGALPPDWSDLLCQIDLTSSDHLQQGALLLAPLNPTRVPGSNSFRCRVAHSFGYGGSPEMTERCLERLDEAGIPGRLEILRVLSDTDNVATQGPVWRLEGKAV